MAYLWFKTFHIIGVVVWFAGLFYLVRLFVYHAEADLKPEPAKTILQQQYQLMEKRLYNFITTPGMVVTAAMAIALLITQPDFLHDSWLHFKLALVALLIGYHFYCGWIMKQLEAGKCNFTSKQFRALNEVPTVLLLIIVLLAVFKNSLPVSGAILSIVAFIILMIATFKIYGKIRQKNEAKLVENMGQQDIYNQG